MTLEPVNIILLSAPHFLSSSNEVPSIKAYNPHFPPELLHSQPKAVFALGHQGIARCEAVPWENTDVSLSKLC